MDEGEDRKPEYLEQLDRYLKGKDRTTLYFELEKDGLTPPFAETLSDEELTQSLTELIWGLWNLGVHIDEADHLTDRELYVKVLDFLDEPAMVFRGNPNYSFHWSPIGSYSTDEEMEISFRYYSSEDGRARFKEQFPDFNMPPIELPPYYRSWLPQRAAEMNVE